MMYTIDIHVWKSIIKNKNKSAALTKFLVKEYIFGQIFKIHNSYSL